MRHTLEDRDHDEDEFLQEFGGALAALRTNACPEPRLLLAFGESVLPEDEATRIGDHLGNCAFCRQLSSQMAALQDADATTDASERVLARIRAASPTKASRAHPRWPWGRWWVMMAPAAAALLLLVVGTKWRDEPQPVASTQPAPPPARQAPLALASLIPLEAAPIQLPVEAMLTWRAEPDPYYSALVPALVPYKDGRYEEAGLKLDEVARRHPRRVEARLYLGVTELMRGRATDAVPHLEAASASGEPLGRTAEWYLAQALLQLEDAERAERWLQRVCDSESQYQQRACGVLETMRHAPKE